MDAKVRDFSLFLGYPYGRLLGIWLGGAYHGSTTFDAHFPSD